MIYITNYVHRYIFVHAPGYMCNGGHVSQAIAELINPRPIFAWTNLAVQGVPSAHTRLKQKYVRIDNALWHANIVPRA